MTVVHYVGPQDERIVRELDFVANGVNDQTTVEFNEANDWQEDVSASAATFLLTMSDFASVGVPHVQDDDSPAADAELEDMAARIIEILEIEAIVGPVGPEGPEGDVGPAGPIGVNLGPVTIGGAVLTVSAGIYRLPIVEDCQILGIRAAAGIAPTGSSAIFDINKNGVTMYATQANRPTFAAGSQAIAPALPDVVTLAAGDYLTFDVDQVGSTIPGGYVVFAFNVVAL